MDGSFVCRVHRPERPDQLSGQDREMTRSVPGLFHGKRPTREPGVGPNRLFGRKHCSVKELVPDRQGEAEVDILRPVEPVVDPMIIRADENPFEPPEAQVGVGVREGDDSRRRRRAQLSARCRWRAARLLGPRRRGKRRGSAGAYGRPSAHSCPLGSDGAHGSARALGRGDSQGGQASSSRPSPRRSPRSPNQRGSTLILARTSHGMDLPTTSENESVNAVTRGTTSVALRTV